MRRKRLIRPTKITLHQAITQSGIHTLPGGYPPGNLQLLIRRFIKFAQHFTLISQRFLTVKFVFPLGNHQHRQRITHHVQRSTRHIEDTVNTGNKCQTFQRNTYAAQRCQQHHKRHARHASNPFRGHHQRQHQNDFARWTGQCHTAER